MARETLKSRSSGAWQTGTVKRRENGQWVTVGSGGGGGGDFDLAADRFYTDEQGPPVRSGSTITYDGSTYSSLQDAHDDLSAGDILEIEPGTYTESLQLTTSHITIRAADPNNRPLITMDGSDRVIWSSGIGDGDHNDEVSLVGGHDHGDEWLSVDSIPSGWSVGDDIHITEHANTYGPPNAGDASGSDTTTEYRTIEEIDTSNNQVKVSHPIFLFYPNNDATGVGVLPWTLEDIYLSGINIQGDSGNSTTPVYMDGIKKLWAEHMEIEESGGDPAWRNGFMYRCRFHDLHFEAPLEDKAMNTFHASTHMYITDISANELTDYIVRFAAGGGDSRCVSDSLTDGVYSERDSGHGRLLNNHWGGYYHNARNVETHGANQVARLRSIEHNINGVDAYISGADANGIISTHQRPTDCTIENVHVHEYNQTNIFSLTAGHEDTIYGNQQMKNLTFRNWTIEDYGASLDTLGTFSSDGSIIAGELRFENITYDGNSLTRSHVEQWENYDLIDWRDGGPDEQLVVE